MKDLILIALDDGSIRQLISRALHAVGYDTTAANDMVGVKKVLKESQPALLLLGTKLGKESSIGIIEKLLSEYPTLPIAFLATEKSSSLTREALRVGVSAYLEPPVNTDELISAIESSLTRARHLGDWVRREVKNTTASLEKRVSEMNILLKIGRDITGNLKLDQVLKNVVSAAVDLTRAEEGSLLLHNKKKNELYMRAGHNFEKGFAESFRLPVTDTLAGQVIKSGEPLLLNKEDAQKIQTAYLVQALIYVPLKINQRIIGVLGVDNRQHRLPFTKRDVLLISLLADYAAVAIENARLYQASEKERSKFEAVLSNMDDALMIIDQKKHILLANDAMCKALQIRFDEVEQKAVSEVVKEQGFLSFIEANRETANAYDEIFLEDDRVFTAQYTSIPDVGYAITMQNISHLKELNRLKDDFVHTVSHDLRSPLTAVLGYAELLERVGTLNEQQREFVRRIQDSVQDITALINDLLDLGRIEAGFDTHRETVQVDQVLRYVLQNQEKKIKAKEQTVDIKIDSELPSIRGNPIRIKQMFDNLLENAIKYTPNGNVISIRMRKKDTQIITKISDQGPGIPQEDQPYIFEKFYRASNIPTSAPGTGLGLAIVKTIVENHNGHIWIDSTLNEGATFSIVLPSI